jgi:hypothetical protein
MAAKSQRLREQEQRWRDRRQARLNYQRWTETSTRALMIQLHAELVQRAGDCARSGGVGFVVQAPRRVHIDEGDAQRIVLSSRLDADVVDIYVQWSQGNAPNVHLLLSRTRRGRPLRLICIPGAWLAPSDDDEGFRLRSFGDSRQTVGVESLCHRAASLLAMD